jgi:uncharacterized protein YukE
MPDFSVDPAELRSHAKNLAGAVAPAYATSSTSVRQGSEISSPGFGIALSGVLEAPYHQRVDFLAKDLQGAHDVCTEIARRLQQTADQYDKAENLNVAGFSGTPQQQESLATAFGQTGLANLDVGAVVATAVPLASIYATLTMMSACSALCPAFIPAAVVGALFVANPLGIAEAGAKLINEGRHIQNQLNLDYLTACNNAAAKWSGEGKDAFQQLTNTVKGHLDQIGKYIETLGEALHSLDIALSALWLALMEMVGPFLLWLVAMKAAEVFPPDIPYIETVVNASGALMSGTVMTTVELVTAVGGTVVTVINGLAKDLLSLTALPDAGKAGVPDLTEFKVGTNFATNL